MIKRKKGFTLVELLVVVAIIALLVSILLPVLSRAKRSTRETICGVHVRNLLTATMFYVSENDDTLPPMSRYPVTVENEYAPGYWAKVYWVNLFADRYGIQRDNFYSPSNPRWSKLAVNYNDGATGDGDDYLMGYFYFGNDNRDQDGEFLNRMVDPPSDVTSPLFARKINQQSYYDWIWSDLNRTLGYEWDPPGYEMSHWGSNHLYDGMDRPRGSHVGYLDGHVGWTDGADIELRMLYGPGYYW